METKSNAILMERFPALGLMMGTWQEKEIPKETIQLPQIERAELLYVYGLGRGEMYFQCQNWLQSKEKKLVFLEDDPGLIASFLQVPQAAEILSHPQVFLELITNKKADVERLAEKFPIRRIEVVGLSSKKGLKSLRLTLLRKTTLTYALHVDRLHGYQPFKNFVENVKQLSHSYYANPLKDSFKGTPAVICGAGPSLQASIQTLKTLENKALIIAGGSTIAALSSQGVLPHFGMAIDPNYEEYLRMKNSFAFEMPLLYSTRVHPGLFQTCNGPFLYMRSGVGGVAEIWMEEELGLKEPLIGDFLSSESISVTSICVAWAQFLGCNPILLNGIDMAYTNQKRYADGVMQEDPLQFEKIDLEKSAPDRILRRKSRDGKTVYTAVRWVMESASLSHFAKKHKEVKFINTTEGGIGIRGVEYVPLQEAVQPFIEQPLRARVYKAILESRMPVDTKKIVPMKIDELAKSLDRLIGYLKILTGHEKGSKALAEFELKEEIAYLYLFYDIRQVLREEPFYEKWLDLALKHRAMV